MLAVLRTSSTFETFLKIKTVGGQVQMSVLMNSLLSSLLFNIKSAFFNVKVDVRYLQLLSVAIHGSKSVDKFLV